MAPSERSLTLDSTVTEYYSHDYERGFSRNRDKEKEWVRDRDRERVWDHNKERDLERVRDKKRDRHFKDCKDMERSERSLCHHSRDDDHDRYHSRDRDSKLINSFDMAPLLSAMVGASGTLPDPVNVPTPAIPGMLSNTVNPLTLAAQFSAISLMPMLAMTQQSVATCFSQLSMSDIGGNTAGPGDDVVKVCLNHEKEFASVKMRSVEEAINLMALDDIIFEGSLVKIRRSYDYNPSLAAAPGPNQPNPNLNLGAVGLSPGSAGGLESPDRIFVGGLPYHFTVTQIREVLEYFGPLRSFDLLKNLEKDDMKFYAFCVYEDPSVTDRACAGLHGMWMGDRKLRVRRANQGTTQPIPRLESILFQGQEHVALQNLIFPTGSPPTKVVCLTHVVTADDLKEDQEFEDILEDTRKEGGKYAKLVNVVIPRPDPNGECTAGVGKVFLEYEDTNGASKARTRLHGRKFGENHVVAVFYPETKFAQGEYDD